MHSIVTSAAWAAHDTQLIVSCLLGLAVIIVLISVLKLAPFLSILIGAFAAGLCAGLPLEELSTSFSRGAGGILGDVGLVIALGAMLGALMAESGAADRLVTTILSYAKGPYIPWMMALVALIVGLPLFFEVGLVMMAPIIFVMAQRAKLPVMKIAIPALAGMTTLHALLPPHPGPLIAVSALHADLGLTMLLGFIVAVPAVILAGPLYGNWLAPRLGEIEPAPISELFTANKAAGQQPGYAASLLTILLPVILMLGRTVARVTMHPGTHAYDLLNVLGEPIVALTITVLVAVVAFGWTQGRSRDMVGGILRKSLPPIAGLLLTIGAGGGLKQVLVAAGMSATLAKIALGSHLPLILLAWGVAVLLRQATGSATVATTTTAGILAPLAVGMTNIHTSLLVLSIGAGSVFFCHINDAGFWMVREYFGLKLKQTFMVWSALQTIVSVVGLVMTLGLWAVLV
jgi:GntP family gluconate:H+ symporter